MKIKNEGDSCVTVWCICDIAINLFIREEQNPNVIALFETFECK